jgi:hypothetical protein
VGADVRRGGMGVAVQAGSGEMTDTMNRHFLPSPFHAII